MPEMVSVDVGPVGVYPLVLPDTECDLAGEHEEAEENGDGDHDPLFIEAAVHASLLGRLGEAALLVSKQEW